MISTGQSFGEIWKEVMLEVKRMNRYLMGFIGMSFLLMLLSPLGVAASTEGEPEGIIQSLSDRLYDVLQTDRERIKNDLSYVYQLADEIVAPHVDFDRVSSLALGKHWRRATPEQKSEFIHQFQRMLVRTYATAFHEFGEWSIRFLPRRDGGAENKIMVRSEVLRPGAPPASVVYRMHFKDGAWKAYDVVIEGVSLVTNYRSSFNQEIRRGGMDALIKRITSMNDKRATAAQQSS
jgi:phospholipid transport system substrate-binding protein